MKVEKDKNLGGDEFFGELNRNLGLSPSSQQPQQQQQTDDTVDKGEGDDQPDIKDDKKDEPKDEGLLKLTPPEKKKDKPTKEDSIQALRSQRDELQKKLKEYEENLGISPAILKPIVDYIKENASGPLTDETVQSIITEFRDTKGRYQDLQRIIEEKEQKIKDLDIQHSDEFQEKYRKPYEDAAIALRYEFAQLNPADGSEIAPKSTQDLFNYLTSKEADSLTQPQIAQALARFKAAYKQESGEEPSPISTANVLNAYRQFIKKRTEIANAYQNWSKEKQEAQMRMQAEQEKQHQLLQAKAKRERVQLVTKAYHELDRDEIDFISEEELSNLFNEEFDYTENAIAGGVNAPTHDVLYQRGVKARLFDKILPEYKELLQLKEKLKKGKNNEIKGGGSGFGFVKQQSDSEFTSPLDELIGLRKR